MRSGRGAWAQRSSRRVPLSDHFAEMDGISAADDDGEQVEPGHAVLLAFATMREGDTLVVPKLDRLARSVPPARAIADQLRERGVKLALGRALYDPSDPMRKLFFNILATFAEFEADLIRLRTREGMAIARAKGKLRGKQPKLSDRQQREFCRKQATGEYSISDLAELFSVSRPTVYRTLNRRHSP